jgi:GTP-binding protein
LPKATRKRQLFKEKPTENTSASAAEKHTQILLACVYLCAMEIKEANFITSFAKATDVKLKQRPEFAFIGRSNVGKSSLINMLTNKKSLAKVSQTPGKTQLINYFEINQKWYLVDLPGYGYARLDFKKRDQLANMINGYILGSQQLALLFVLIDSNVEPKAADLEFLGRLSDKDVPFMLLFTKADKGKPAGVVARVQAFMDKLAETWDELPPYIVTSAEHKTGRKEVLSMISQILHAK